jgi:hypothetical protein
LQRGTGEVRREVLLVNDFPGLLVLRGAQEYSAEMAEKIGAHDAEFVLRQIPRELRGRGRSINGGTYARAFSVSSRRSCNRCAMK